MKCPACNENEASAVTYGLCDGCIAKVYYSDAKAVEVIEKLTNHIAQVYKSREQIHLLSKDRYTRIKQLEQALAEMEVYMAQQLAPEIARRELAEKRVAELEADNDKLDGYAFINGSHVAIRDLV